MSNSLETSNTHYKKLEIMSNYSRDMMIEKILDDIVDKLSNTYSGDDLIAEIVELNLNGAHAINEMDDKQLAEKCVEIFDNNDEWGDEV